MPRHRYPVYSEARPDYYTFDNEENIYIFYSKMICYKDFTVEELVGKLIPWDFRYYPMEAYNYASDEPSVFQVPDSDDTDFYGGYEEWVKFKTDRKESKELRPYTINVDGKFLYLGGYNEEWDHYECNESMVIDEIKKQGVDMNQETIVMKLEF
tara:strand:- start:579 stop:1040 length:462 start_codon:yes stop_codon:yes gene_type:complete